MRKEILFDRLKVFIFITIIASLIILVIISPYILKKRIPLIMIHLKHQNRKKTLKKMITRSQMH